MKYTRLTGKLFGETADPTDDPILGPAIGQFGSAKLGTYVGTDDVATIQNLSAWSNGWIDAVTPTNQYPALPERTGVDKVLSYQENYILQQGIPEYDANTEYYTNNFCSYNGEIYRSIVDEHTGQQPDISPDYWVNYLANIQCAPFTINKGSSNANGQNITLSYSGSTLTCAPCTITTCDYRTTTDTETRTLDLSTATGRLYVFKSYSTGELSFIEERRFGIGKAIPVNIIPIGDLSIDNGVLSNFSNDHYARSMQSFNPGSSKWSIVLKITTGADVSSTQSLIGSSTSTYDPVVLYINNGKFAFGISYNITQTDASATGSYNVQANTTYYVKLEWTGTQYRLSYSTDGTNFTLDASYNSTTHAYSGAVLIIGASRAGNAMATPWGGTVDLKESYFEIIDNYTYNFTPDNWLDITQPMYQFKKLVDGVWVVDNDRVAIGSVLVSSGTITEVENYDFNLESKWKANFVNLASSTNLPTTLTAVYRIQDYLPHDNCQYEVLIDGSCITGTTSGNRADLEAHTDIIKLGTCAICFAITRTSSSNISAGSTILPTGRGRALLVPYAANNTGTYYLNILGYRRLGFTE